jgi:hypothetical protein
MVQRQCELGEHIRGAPGDVGGRQSEPNVVGVDRRIRQQRPRLKPGVDVKHLRGWTDIRRPQAARNRQAVLIPVRQEVQSRLVVGLHPRPMRRDRWELDWIKPVFDVAHAALLVRLM